MAHRPSPDAVPMLSVCSGMLQPLSLDEVCRTISEAGIEGVELLGEPARYDEPELCRALDAQGLRVTALTAAARLANGRDLSHPDPHPRAKAAEHLQGCIAFARRVGAPVVAVAPAAVGRHWLEGTRDDEWAWCVEGLRRLAETADGEGVALGIEILNRYAAPTVTDVDTALRLVDDVGGGPVGVIMDVFHAAFEEPSVADAVRRAGPRLVNVQVADNTREGPGRGSVDFAAIAEALADIGYGGALALEAFPRRCGAFPDVGQDDLVDTVAYVHEFRRFVHGLPAFAGSVPS